MLCASLIIYHLVPLETPTPVTLTFISLLSKSSKPNSTHPWQTRHGSGPHCACAEFAGHVTVSRGHDEAEALLRGVARVPLQRVIHRAPGEQRRAYLIIHLTIHLVAGYITKKFMLCEPISPMYRTDKFGAMTRTGFRCYLN